MARVFDLQSRRTIPEWWAVTDCGCGLTGCQRCAEDAARLARARAESMWTRPMGEARDIAVTAPIPEAGEADGRGA